ncbi:DJ-1/PfpI family protein [Jiangella mangrovi]|uniref:Transcriptional regulator GlxA family with amidase domain n=1 Tax=Jiangella mangrovi TaxID=1524084 RepID=A0A7W9GWB3_9ACTN|nr:DJ-1/PfpI family protein [Jiangella mangrovi]MBB5791152.1 transcriptional regulator GlxA family with amidase domain [Jiangella mangrovi]
MAASSTCAIVAYRGVSADEAEIFRFVLSQIPGFRTVVVGTALGQVPGPGGAQTVDATFAEINAPEIVAVPGGVGADRHPEIASWLRRVSPRWLLASSTGSTLLASAGLLDDATAATHWLAGPLLERYGAHPSAERLVIDGPVITCSGGPAAFQAALIVARSYGGPELVAAIAATATAARAERPPRRSAWARVRDALRGREPAPLESNPLDRALGDVETFDLGVITAHPDRRDDER